MANNARAHAPEYYAFEKERGRIYLTSSVYAPSLVAHTHGFVELVCITKGCGKHTVDGHTMTARRGDVFLIDYAARHDFAPIKEPFAWINCIFRPELLCGVFATQESAKDLLYYLFYRNAPLGRENVTLAVNLRPEADEACGIFEDMLREYEAKAAGYEEVLEHYLMILLAKIARRVFSAAADRPAGKRGEDLIGDVLRRLSQSEPGSVGAKELADSYFLSPSAFSERFKRVVGVSFLEYVTGARVDRACELLLTTDLSVGEIRERVGYADAKAFYSAFRRRVGMTPTQYKKQGGAKEKNT